MLSGLSVDQTMHALKGTTAYYRGRLAVYLDVHSCSIWSPRLLPTTSEAQCSVAGQGVDVYVSF